MQSLQHSSVALPSPFPRSPSCETIELAFESSVLQSLNRSRLSLAELATSCPPSAYDKRLKQRQFYYLVTTKSCYFASRPYTRAAKQAKQKRTLKSKVPMQGWECGIPRLARAYGYT